MESFDAAGSGNNLEACYGCRFKSGKKDPESRLRRDINLLHGNSTDEEFENQNERHHKTEDGFKGLKPYYIIADVGEGGGKKKGETGGSEIDDPNRNPNQDKKLTPGEIDILKKHGWDYSQKPRGSGGQVDLYKDRKGNVYEKPKGGDGYGEPIGINLNNLIPNFSTPPAGGISPTTMVKAGVGTAIGIGLYEFGKWAIATVLAPETGGASFGVAAVLP
jgi:hypothetical protein